MAILDSNWARRGSAVLLLIYLTALITGTHLPHPEDLISIEGNDKWLHFGAYFGLALLMLVTLAAPMRATAHGGDNGPLATNYRSEISDPGADGLTWSARGGDGLVELNNDTGQEVVVFGYQAEPYLWFVPGDGVYRNTSSPATYLNEDRYGDVDMPAGTSASAAPDWEQVTAGNTYAWHDHRAHWMSRIDPPVVAADRSSEHLVLDFEIPLQVGADDAAAAGDLRWLPDVAWWPPVVALTTIASVLVAAVALATRPTQDRWAPIARVATVIVLGVVAANLVRVVDDLGSYPTSSERAVIIITALVTLGVVVALCTRSWKGHPGGFGALAVAALMVMLLYGGEAGSELSAPQLDTSFPDWVRRWTIAASYAVVAPAFLAAGIGAWWHARTLRDAAPAERPVPAPST